MRVIDIIKKLNKEFFITESSVYEIKTRLGFKGRCTDDQAKQIMTIARKIYKSDEEVTLSHINEYFKELNNDKQRTGTSNC